MSRTFCTPGHRRTVIASGAIAPGDVVVLRSGAAGEIGVAEDAIADTERGEVQVSGVHNLPLAAETIGRNALVYWDNTAKKITATSTSNTLAGVTHAPGTSGDATIPVLVNGRPGSALSD